MMAMGELQLVRGILFTTIQTCHAHFGGPGAPKIAAQKIPRKVQNGAKIIMFALFGMFFDIFYKKNAFYMRIINDRASIMALREPQ